MRSGIYIVALSAFLSACGSESVPEQTKAPAIPEVRVEAARNEGSYGAISGLVVFDGSIPKPRKISVNKDLEVCGKESASEDLVISVDRGIRWAVVSLENLDARTPIKPDASVLDQKGCRFVPHVVIVPNGGRVDIKNSDGILHNFHTFSESNSPINKAQPKFKKVMTEEFGIPEFVKVACDVHSWMSGWIIVTKHPWYAVTDKKGKFKLENVPAGKHLLRVWHEKLGELYTEVEVRAGEETKLPLSLKLPL